jgi:hypothetical protein
MCQPQACHAAIRSRRFCQSPTCALVDFVVGCRLRGQIPVRLDFATPSPVCALPQSSHSGGPRAGTDVRGFGVDPMWSRILPDLRALGDEGDQAHLPTAQRAQQREHFVDTGDQHRPQVMRLRAFGWRRFGLGGLAWPSGTALGAPSVMLAGSACTTTCLAGAASCHRRSSERRIRCQHTKIAVAVGARRWHQRGNAVYQLQRCEGQLVCLGATLVRLPGSLRCLAQRYTKAEPSLRRRSMAKGGRAQ